MAVEYMMADRMTVEAVVIDKAEVDNMNLHRDQALRRFESRTNQAIEAHKCLDGRPWSQDIDCIHMYPQSSTFQSPKDNQRTIPKTVKSARSRSYADFMLVQANAKTCAL